MFRTSLFVTTTVLILMVLFPPFQVTTGGSSINMGYGFLLHPPEFYTGVYHSDPAHTPVSFAASVNTGLLLIQVLVVAAGGSMIALALRAAPKPNHALQRTEAGGRLGSEFPLDLASLCR